MTHEIEIKLRFDPDHAGRLAAALSRRAREAFHSTLKNDYYDTADAALARAKSALRIRSKSAVDDAGSIRAYEQTLKTRGQSVGGVHQRHEWNWPLASEALDTSLLQQPEVQPHLPAGLAVEQLQVLFSTNFERRGWIWQIGDSQVELVMDRGEIRAGSQMLPLCELELELLSGDAESLWWMAQSLCSEVPLWTSDISKAERGYRLAGLAPEWQPSLADDINGDSHALAWVNRLLLISQRSLEGLLWDQDAGQAPVSCWYLLMLERLLARLPCQQGLQLAQPLHMLASAALLQREGTSATSRMAQVLRDQIRILRSQTDLATRLLLLGQWCWQQSGRQDVEPVLINTLLADLQQRLEGPDSAGVESWLLSDQGLADAGWLLLAHGEPMSLAREFWQTCIARQGLDFYGPCLTAEASERLQHSADRLRTALCEPLLSIQFSSGKP